MSNTTVTYIGAHDQIEVEVAPGVWRTVADGEELAVPPAVAGRAPEGDDPGSGLLAQPDVWAAEPKAKPKTTRKPKTPPAA